MASTNKTTHYELSQFVSSDIPAWLVDYNGDMSKIDTGIAQAKTSADTAGQTADTAIANASNAQETANTAVTNAGVADTKATTANTNIGTMADLETAEKTSLVGAINEVLGKLYPVGSIYLSVNSINPTTLFGGTWVQIKDKFLLGAGDTYELGTVGGEAEHTLTINEMPSHTHKQAVASASGASAETLSMGNRTSQTDVPSIYAIQATGGGQAHNNMPPYEVVSVWKRTA